MDEEEILGEFTSRFLNSKTNNYVITNTIDLSILNRIPDICSVTMDDNYLGIEKALNIKIDLKEVEVKDVLSFVLNYLKELKLVDSSFELKLNSKFDLLKFQGILRKYNIIVQMICINVESLSEEEQMLLNEIYYFNSMFFNITSFVKDNLKTYFLTENRVLDDRENYEKVKLIQKNNFNKQLIKEIEN